MADLEARLAALEGLVADLAEFVGTGRASHMTTLDQNVAVSIANTLRPGSVTPDEVPGPVEICGAPKDDKPGALVCLRPKGHERSPDKTQRGHAYGVPEIIEEAPSVTG